MTEVLSPLQNVPSFTSNKVLDGNDDYVSFHKALLVCCKLYLTRDPDTPMKDSETFSKLCNILMYIIANIEILIKFSIAKRIKKTPENAYKLVSVLHFLNAVDSLDFGRLLRKLRTHIRKKDSAEERQYVTSAIKCYSILYRNIPWLKITRKKVFSMIMKCTPCIQTIEIQRYLAQ